jgi:hypothetical protein
VTTGKERAQAYEREKAALLAGHYAAVALPRTPTRQVIRALIRAKAKAEARKKPTYSPKRKRGAM